MNDKFQQDRSSNTWNERNQYLSTGANTKLDKKRVSSSFSYQSEHLQQNDKYKNDEIDYKTALSDDKRQYRTRSHRSLQEQLNYDDYEELKDDNENQTTVYLSPTKENSFHRRHSTKNQFLPNINEDLQFQFLDSERKQKKGSSDGDEYDQDVQIEQQQYFVNEEKVIKNHLKLNLGLQGAQIIIFILAILIFDWTHLHVTIEKDHVRDYHVTLMQLETDDEYKEVTWLYSLTNSCIDKESGEASSVPDQLCERAGSLFLAGAFTGVGLSICVILNIYITLSLALFIKKFQLSPFQMVIYLKPYSLLVVSMSFIYVADIGLGQYFSMIGIIFAVLSRQHFLKLNRKIIHLSLVKNFMVDEQ
ncbi:UNKNOWN [Stylonychia lemnae]|uniref:Transmembrane protein n=1 Tax=Stylonychia lemnae TaxID=5949 RepID=A0A078AZM4_STYLE|nr:UNKNOWN [Stylonychia lemnae]|eukprot:CDW87551.1 UNKNOWN [Stylonychia lemnae]